MNRYIRTKDGKIIDTKEMIIINGTLFCGDDKFNNKAELLNEIIKKADTIEDLIMDGDLAHDSECDEMFFIDNFTIFDYGAFDELYTKQNNDYILVARKENGEWRVI